MAKQLITFLLMIGLNMPVFYELYKHVLQRKKGVFQISGTLLFWMIAFWTQTLSALMGIVFLYFAFYRNIETDEAVRDIHIWQIGIRDVIPITALSIFARGVLLIINLLYVVVLDQLLRYDIKPQEIVTYYAQSQWWLKAILAVEIVMIAPMVEEFAFRFFLYDRVLVRKMPKFIAALISAGIFALVHFNLSGVPTFLGLGLFCALMYEKRGYWGAVIAHGVSNAFTLLFL